MAPIVLASLAGGALGLFGSAMTNATNSAATASTNRTNRDIASANLDYQREYNEQIFAREDNAVQRRAADLEAAGLSKTLAAGSPAGAGGSASAPVNMHREDSGPPAQDVIASGITSASTIANMITTAQAQQLQNEKTQAEIDQQTIVNEYLAAQIVADLDNKKASTESVRAGTSKTNLETSVLNYDFGYAKRAGMMHQSTGVATDVMKHVLGMNEEQWKKYGNRIEQFLGVLLGDNQDVLDLLNGTSSGSGKTGGKFSSPSASKRAVDNWMLNKLKQAPY